MNPAVRPVDPTRADVTRAWIEKYLNNLHTALPGRVERYDAATQTADVVPLIRHPVAQPDGSYVLEDLPVLPSVLVLFPRFGPWFVAGGLAAGDPVIVWFCERGIGAWWAGDGSVQDPEDYGAHELAYAVCAPMNFVPRSKALAHAPAGSALVIGSDADDGMRFTFNADGTVDLGDGATDGVARLNDTCDAGTLVFTPNVGTAPAVLVYIPPGGTVPVVTPPAIALPLSAVINAASTKVRSG